MEIQKDRITRLRVKLSPDEQVEWQGGARTTFVVTSATAEFVWPDGEFKFIEIFGYRKERPATKLEHKFGGGTAPTVLHPLVRDLMAAQYELVEPIPHRG